MEIREQDLGDDRYPKLADGVFRRSLPSIPAATEFLRDFEYAPVREIVYWDWSHDFSKWGAVVVFPDGRRVWTWPRPSAA